MYSISHIQEVIQAKAWGYCDVDINLRHLAYDTRRIRQVQHTLFFALKGSHRDGHQYVEEAYKLGVRAFVISGEVHVNTMPNAIFLQVKDTLHALQHLAAYHRSQFSPLTIGITGSNGKTIVKEWLYQMLTGTHSVVRSPGSYNSQLGVPLSLWQLDECHEIALFEAGISQSGEMQALAEMIRCDVGIITNVGSAHDAGFESRIEKIAEKSLLFQYAHTILYCADHLDIATYLNKKYPDKKRLHWSRTQPSSLRLIHQQSDQKGCKITVIWKAQSIEFTLPFDDRASIDNAMMVILMMLYLHHPVAIIQQKLLSLQPIAMRMEVKRGINGSRIINDSYNADIESVEAALAFLSQQAGSQRRVLILSDLYQSRRSDEELYGHIAELIEKHRIAICIGIGTQVALLAKHIQSDWYAFENTDDFLQNVDYQIFTNAVVLVKGARLFAFERITERLVQHTHRTVLEVSLPAIRHNLEVYSRFLSPSVKIMAMVKAAAYGAGSEEVARYLQSRHIAALAVAYADEGVALRKAGIHLPILVLNPNMESFEQLLTYDLQAEIYSLTQLTSLTAFLGIRTRGFSIQIKLNTGMNRLGMDPADIEWLSQHLVQHGYRVTGIFSHLADAADVAFVHRQVQLFEQMSRQLMVHLGYSPSRHLLNSSGILQYPEYAYETVRLGIGLYGHDDTGRVASSLETVLRLYTVVCQLRKLPAGSTIGYSPSTVLAKDSHIATVAIGYADGLPRSVGEGVFSLLVNGHWAPIVGKICMDMCMIDVSEIPEVQEGDRVEVFGVRHSICNLAQAAHTIPYEIISGISNRVPRIYIEE